MEIEIILYSLPGERNNKNFPPNYSGEDSVRSICEGPDKKVYFISNRNRIFWQPSDDGGMVSVLSISLPPIIKISSYQKYGLTPKAIFI